MHKLLVFVLSFSFAAFCQSPSHAGQTSSNQNDSSDSQFLKKAAQGNMAEVAMGKLATQKAQSDDVKKFGQRMVDEHTKAEQDLEGVASKNNWTPPSDMSAMQKSDEQRLEKMKGAAFDRAYMQMMVKDHVGDVAEFKKESNNSGANSDLRDYAKRTYPTLDDHLTNAKAVRDALSAKTGSKTSKNSGSSQAGGSGLLLI